MAVCGDCLPGGEWRCTLRRRSGSDFGARGRQPRTRQHRKKKCRRGWAPQGERDWRRQEAERAKCRRSKEEPWRSRSTPAPPGLAERDTMREGRLAEQQREQSCAIAGNANGGLVRLDDVQGRRRRAPGNDDQMGPGPRREKSARSTVCDARDLGEGEQRRRGGATRDARARAVQSADRPAPGGSPRMQVSGSLTRCRWSLAGGKQCTGLNMSLWVYEVGYLVLLRVRRVLGTAGAEATPGPVYSS